MPTPVPASFRWRFYLPLIAFTAAILAVIWGVMFQVVMQDRKNEEKAWLNHTASLTRLLESQTESTLDYVDAVLWQLKVQHEQKSGSINMAQLFGYINTRPDLVIGSAITNARGDYIFSTSPTVTAKPLNLSDRPYFRAHQSKDTNKLLLSPPERANSADRPILIATRRINNANGGFDGVVALLLEPRHFTERHGDFNLGAQRSIMLGGLDGIVRSRFTGGTFDAGLTFANTEVYKQAQFARAGSYLGADTLDGMHRAVSYRVLANYPLLVVIGVSSDKMYEEHYERRREQLINAGAATLFVLLIAWLLGTLLLRATRAEAALPESQARLRMATDAASMTNWEWDIGAEHVRWGEGAKARRRYWDLVPALTATTRTSGRWCWKKTANDTSRRGGQPWITTHLTRLNSGWWGRTA